MYDRRLGGHLLALAESEWYSGVGVIDQNCCIEVLDHRRHDYSAAKLDKVMDSEECARKPITLDSQTSYNNHISVSLLDVHTESLLP